MANIIKIRYYLDLIKELHCNKITNPSEILSSLLRTYLTNKKNKHSLSHTAGVLFTDKIPSMFAKKLINNLDILDFNTCLTKANTTLTSYFIKYKNKKNGEFAALWIAFFYFYHPIISKPKPNTFFKEAIITSKLYRKKYLNEAIDTLFMDINYNNDYNELTIACGKLINIIKVCKLSWITPKHQKQLVNALTWLPFWQNDIYDSDDDSILVAVDTLKNLLSEEMLIKFYIDTLSNLASDIQFTHYRTLYVVSRIPLCDLKEKNVTEKFIKLIDHHYLTDENDEENFSEHRLCTLLEIILKITTDENIHTIVYNKISELLDSEDINSVEMLIRKINIPEKYKKIYIFKLLDNLKTNIRSRHEITITLDKLIESDEDKEQYFDVLINILIKKNCLSAVASLKALSLSDILLKKLSEAVIQLLKCPMAYLGLELIRANKFNQKQKNEMLLLLRNLIKTNASNTCIYVDAMNYLTDIENDFKLMANTILTILDSANDIQAINLLSKIKIPYELLNVVTNKLMEKLQSPGQDYYTTSSIIITIISLELRYKAFNIINIEVFFDRVLFVLKTHSHDHSFERVCHALLKINIPPIFLTKIIKNLMKTSKSSSTYISNASIYFLTQRNTCIIKKLEIITIILDHLSYCLDNNYHADIIINHIEVLIKLMVENFNPFEQIALITIIEETLVTHEVVADFIINKIYSLIELEAKLSDENILPVEMTKSIFQFI